MIDWVFGFDQNPPSPEKLGTTRTRCRPRLSQIAARCPTGRRRILMAYQSKRWAWVFVMLATRH